MPEDFVRQPQPVFAQARELRQAEAERTVVAQRAEIAQVVGDPFALEHQRTQPLRALGHDAAGGRLQRHAERPGERHGGIAR